MEQLRWDDETSDQGQDITVKNVFQGNRKCELRYRNATSNYPSLHNNADVFAQCEIAADL